MPRKISARKTIIYAPLPELAAAAQRNIILAARLVQSKPYEIAQE